MLTPNQLHSYQQKAVNFQSSLPNTMLWLDMGLGKTAITLTTIAHLKRMGFLRGVIIVAPIRVVRLVWKQEAAKWEHTKHLTFSNVVGTKDQRTRALLRDADIYLINHENLGWLSETLHTYFISKKKSMPFNGLVWDECFVAGTLVQTPDSHVAIDKLKIGDVVSTHLGPRRVLNTMRKTVTSLVEVRLSNGNVLRCTPNHPFSVGNGWVAAGSLKKGDLLNEASQYSEIRGGLLSDLPGGVLEAPRRTVHMLEDMREHLAYAATGNQEGDHVRRNQSVTETSRPVRDLEQGCSLVGRSTHEDERVSQEAESLSPDGWERDRRIMGRKPDEDDTTTTVHTGICPQEREEVGRILDTLQNRFCGPSEQDSCRDSRPVAQHRTWEDEGREEATSSGGTWVESVLHHEQGSGVDVWNIHVEDAETYYVGGVLVHNCSKMKNSSTARVRSYLKIEDHFDWVTGLTGTPASNGYKDLHGQFLVVDKGQRLGRYKTKFKQQYYYKQGPYKEVPFPNSENEIKARISDITLEMSAEDYNPLPDMIVNNIELEMDGECRAKYERMEKELFLQMDSGNDIELFNQASLTNKALQFSNGAVYPVAGLPAWEPIHDLKLDALEEIIDEAQGQPIFLAYAYRSDAERIMKKFEHLKPINLTECKSQSSLENAMARWKSGDCPLMIAHPASCGHGIDGLQANGHILVWFGLTWSLDLYDQFNARIRRQGQGRPVMCHRIMVSKTLDQAQVLALDEKATTQTDLRNAVKQYRLEKGV